MNLYQAVLPALASALIGVAAAPSASRAAPLAPMASPIAEQVIKTIVEQLEVKREDVTPEASLTKDLGADSIDLLELFMALEQEFAIDITEAQCEQMTEVDDVIKTVERAMEPRP